MSTNPEPSTRRGGARDARRAARSAPLPDNLKPVRRGMSGGRYKPLSDADVLKIHHAALDAQAHIGKRLHAAKALARAMAYTKQVKAAAVLNNGWASTVTYGDGQVDNGGAVLDAD